MYKRQRLVAVNLDPSEGRVTPFDPAVDFAALGIPLLDDSETEVLPELSGTEKIQAESQQKEAKQKLWKWLILIALALLLLETWLAGRRSPRSSESVPTAAPLPSPAP